MVVCGHGEFRGRRVACVGNRPRLQQVRLIREISCAGVNQLRWVKYSVASSRVASEAFATLPELNGGCGSYSIIS